MYGHALSLSEANADAIYRLCSLWLGNCEDDDFCAGARKAIMSIPSYRYLHLVPQLSARLAALESQGQSHFQITLHKLLERLAVEHPYHSLFQLYFLYNTGASGASQAKSQRRRSSVPELSMHGPVRDILARLHQLETMSGTMREIEQAIEAYAEWAAMKVEKQRPSADKLRPMPNHLKLLKLSNLSIPVTTVAIPIDKTCNYPTSSLPCIVGYKKTYTTAGGVNLPKITDCVGSDGATYRQLVRVPASRED